MGATLDESYNDEDDEIFTIEGITAVIEKPLYETLSNIEIAFNEEKGIVVNFDTK